VNDINDNIKYSSETPRKKLTGLSLKKRATLKQLAALCGLSLSPHCIALLSPTSTLRVSTLFNSEQLQLTGVLVELIIPTTDTPGALAANVHSFIDCYLADCVDKYEQELCLSGLKKLNIIANKELNKDFIACSNEQQTRILTWLENISNGFVSDDLQFFGFLKSLTIFGYYTSEIGATQELAYLAIPGAYKGNYPLSNIKKSWSLS
jgi:hypothetical protein